MKIITLMKEEISFNYIHLILFLFHLFLRETS